MEKYKLNSEIVCTNTWISSQTSKYTHFFVLELTACVCVCFKSAADVSTVLMWTCLLLFWSVFLEFEHCCCSECGCEVRVCMLLISSVSFCNCVSLCPLSSVTLCVSSLFKSTIHRFCLIRGSKEGKQQLWQKKGKIYQ